MTRIRENSESIALIKGANDERDRLTETFQQIAARWLDVIRQNCHLTWVLNSNTFFSPILPLLLAVPKYLSGELSLGSVMQLAAAFTAVLTALNWFAENYIRLAEWSASAKRVQELDDALTEMDDDNERAAAIVIENVSADVIELRDLSISHRDGRVVIDDTDITVKPGERVLLGGESGSGKSTLIRAIAGLWPWGEGRILLPEGAKLAFVPQRPYVPLGNLHAVLAYPVESGHLSGEKARTVLRDVGLGYLQDKLEAEAYAGIRPYPAAKGRGWRLPGCSWKSRILSSWTKQLRPSTSIANLDCSLSCSNVCPAPPSSALAIVQVCKSCTVDYSL